MSRLKPIAFLAAAFAVAFGLLAIATPAYAASTEKVLYSFCGYSNDCTGYFPQGNLILDNAGNLYGTTYRGNTDDGNVFELSPGSNGTWTETVLYSFTGGGDGGYPNGGLIFDAAGNLYGVTQSGGNTNCNCGTVFELSPGRNGTWTETVLYSFTGPDGYGPRAGLTFDSAGNLYGTTQGGGAIGSGTVYQLTPGSNGLWTEKVIHSFNPKVKDGWTPFSPVTFDTSGNLYGTTQRGGTGGGYGTVFQLTPHANGKWTEKLLRSFGGDGKDGASPWAGVILDAAGNLYGTTNHGGTDRSGCIFQQQGQGCGTVFQLTPGANGKWTETVLHSFSNNGKDGYEPQASLILDAAGNLYGTTVWGGSAQGSECYGDGCGIVFQLTPGGKGKWTEKILHNFDPEKMDGYNPVYGLILDAAGNLYGTTEWGGANGGGAVFEVTP